MNIKVIIENGVVHDIIKDSNEPVHVEVVDIDKDYGDAKALREYRDSLYKDPKYVDCDYNVAHFESDLKQ